MKKRNINPADKSNSQLYIEDMGLKRRNGQFVEILRKLAEGEMCVADLDIKN